MKQVFYLPLEEFDQTRMAECMQLFPQEQVEYVMAMHHLQGQRERAAAYQLLVDGLKKMNFLNEMPLIGHSEHGKPYLINYPQIYFNQSHCKNSVAVVISNEGEVGIDVECRRKVSDSLIHRVCNSMELQQIADAQDSELEFLRIWTRKEAYVKHLGTGIQDDLKNVEELASNDQYIIESTPLPPPIEGWISVCYKG